MVAGVRSSAAHPRGRAAIRAIVAKRHGTDPDVSWSISTHMPTTSTRRAPRNSSPRRPKIGVGPDSRLRRPLGKAHRWWSGTGSRWGSCRGTAVRPEHVVHGWRGAKTESRKRLPLTLTPPGLGGLRTPHLMNGRSYFRAIRAVDWCRWPHPLRSSRGRAGLHVLSADYLLRDGTERRRVVASRLRGMVRRRSHGPRNGAGGVRTIRTDSPPASACDAGRLDGRALPGETRMRGR